MYFVDSIVKYLVVSPWFYPLLLAQCSARLQALLLFEGILWTLFFPLDFEGKIH